MSRYLLLDSGPLGLVTQPRISPEVVAINHWLIACLSSGDRVLVPAIIYYELRPNYSGHGRPWGWLVWYLRPD